MSKRRRHTLHIRMQACKSSRESERHSTGTTVQSSQHLRVRSMLRNWEGRHSREWRRRSSKVGRRSTGRHSIHICRHKHLMRRVCRMTRILRREVGRNTTYWAIRAVENLEGHVVAADTRGTTEEWRGRRGTLLMLLRRRTGKPRRRSNLAVRLRWRRLRDRRMALRPWIPSRRRPAMVVHKLWRGSTRTAQIDGAGNPRIVVLTLGAEHGNGRVIKACWR